MTRYEAYIDKHWKEHGLASVIVVRKRDEASADLGVFLVDVWCLGVKDAYGETEVPVGAVDELVDQRLPEENREAIHPVCAKKLIDGAIAYAERFGFAPHRDFRKARKVLSGLDASLCPTEFAFGREGKPCYMRGPEDSDERVDRILAILDARCGEGGYHFVDLVAEAEGELDIDGVRDELMAWLDREPAAVPRFYELSGLVTAMQLCPKVLSPAKLIGKFWGPEGRPWRDEEEVREFSALLTAYWNYIVDLLAASVEPDAAIEDQAIDVWLDDFAENDQVSVLAATYTWARGFILATKLWPEAWGDALTRPELVEHWEMIRWWAEFVGPGNSDRITETAGATPPRNIGSSVQALARGLRARSA